MVELVARRIVELDHEAVAAGTAAPTRRTSRQPASGDADRRSRRATPTRRGEPTPTPAASRRRAPDDGSPTVDATDADAAAADAGRAARPRPTCRAPSTGGHAVVGPIPLPMSCRTARRLGRPPLDRGRRADAGRPTRRADRSPRSADRRRTGRAGAALVGRRPRVRQVTRVVRHVDPWSVFKVALVFNLVLYVVLLTAGVLLWNVAYATGTVDNLERFFESFGWCDVRVPRRGDLPRRLDRRAVRRDRPHRRGRARGHAVQPDHRPRRRACASPCSRRRSSGAHDGADAALRRAPPDGAERAAIRPNGLRRESDRLPEPHVAEQRAVTVDFTTGPGL